MCLRPLLPEDRQELVVAFERLSDTSRYSRFFAPLHRLTDRMLRTLVDEVDEVDHMARVMSAVRPGDVELPIGIGRIIRSKQSPDTAEVALTVADQWQGQGAGTIMVRALAGLAQRRGIRFVTASVLADNPAAGRLMKHMGAIVDRALDGSTIEFRVDLDADAGTRS